MCNLEPAPSPQPLEEEKKEDEKKAVVEEKKEEMTRETAKSFGSRKRGRREFEGAQQSPLQTTILRSSYRPFHAPPPNKRAKTNHNRNQNVNVNAGTENEAKQVRNIYYFLLRRIFFCSIVMILLIVCLLNRNHQMRCRLNRHQWHRHNG